MLRRRERGDTLIEVLFAVTVFSLMVVGALMIMNQGTAAAQRSLEITLVRQQIDGQAETLRFMHDSYVAVYRPGITFNETDAQTSPAEEWYKLQRAIDPSRTTASAFAVGERCPSTKPQGSFVVDPRTARYMGTAAYQPAETFAQLHYNPNGTFGASRGLWVEAIRSENSGGNAGFIDFHIRACWDSEGSSIRSTQGTIVRLYEPRG